MTDAATARFAPEAAVVDELSSLDRFVGLDDVAVWTRNRFCPPRTSHHGAPR